MPEGTAVAVVEEQVPIPSALVSSVESFIVKSNEEYISAGAKREEVKAEWKKYDDERRDLVDDLNKTVKKINDRYRPVLTALKGAEEMIRSKMIGWDNELKRQQAEANRIAQETARKEQARLDDIARKKAEKADAKGDTEKAEAIRESVPVVVAAPVFVAERPKVVGTRVAPVWAYKVTDVSLVPREYMTPNDAVLGPLARATKGALKIPGIEIFDKNAAL